MCDEIITSRRGSLRHSINGVVCRRLRLTRLHGERGIIYCKLRINFDVSRAHEFRVCISKTKSFQYKNTGRPSSIDRREHLEPYFIALFVGEDLIKRVRIYNDEISRSFYDEANIR